MDVELSIRGILRGFGLKVGVVSKGRLAVRIRELVTGQALLERVIEPMLRARDALRAEHYALHRAMLGASSARTRMFSSRTRTVMARSTSTSPTRTYRKAWPSASASAGRPGRCRI